MPPPSSPPPASPPPAGPFSARSADPFLIPAPRLVGPGDLETCLAAVLAGAPRDADGLFDPDGPLCRVDREAALFLGAGRALLLQLAHPWVAAGVAAHSVALDDPIGRFHRTFGTVYAMVFGTRDQALGAARRLHRRHSVVTGRLPAAAGDQPAGAPYLANQTAALAWVHATLADTALLVHDRVLPPLASDLRETYLSESRRFAGLFGLRPDDLPPDWAGFQGWMAAMLDGPSLVVTDDARRVAWTLFRGSSPWLRLPGWYLDLTAGMLPPRLRDGFGLPWDDRRAARVERTWALFRGLLPRLPSLLRHVGPWHEADRRRHGHAGPDAVTRLSNRIWIGRDRL